MRTLACVVATLLVFAATARAQHEQHAVSLDKIGTVHFETSCDPSVRTDFDRAVALLHSFEFRPAMDGFTAVLQRDSSCAIAYWGIALCHWGNPFAGIKSGPPLERGRATVADGLKAGNPSPRERAYLTAVNELFANADTVAHRDRTVAYAHAMERVQADFPQDVEARIFYALAVSQTADPADKTYSAQLKAAGILEPLWKQYPNHPGLPHYIIHAYDSPALAPRALAAAQEYAKIAPSAPHALHMPSHTFTRVGYWKESAETNVLSEQAAMKLNVFGEALHAMDYQVYAYLQMARDADALSVVQRMPAVMAKLDVTAVGGAAPGSAGVYATAAIPARYALERGAWTDAAALTARSSSIPYSDAVTRFARALGAARSGSPQSAQADIDELAALRDKLAAMREDYWRNQVEIERRVASAWAAFAAGRRDEGLELMRGAADAEDATDKAAISPGPLAPARELLGEMLLEAGRYGDALTAFEATMKKEPRRFRGTYGAARAAEGAGDRGKAKQYYAALLEIVGDTPSARPEIARAREAMSSENGRKGG
jgi:hypothetical protein